MKRIAVIGMGTMGSAIHGLLQGEFDVDGIDRDRDLAVVANSDLAIVAIKPQSFNELAKGLRSHLDRQTVISIMAGIAVERLAEALGTDRVIRTMPSLALKIGRSLTGWYASSDRLDFDTAQTIFARWGDSVRLEQEDQFHAFTAVAGSGPAYFAMFAEQLAQAGAQQGLDAVTANMTALHALQAADLLLTQGGDKPGELVGRITSKGGTTEAARAVFEERGFGQIVSQAVVAACERSIELGGK